MTRTIPVLLALALAVSAAGCTSEPSPQVGTATSTPLTTPTPAPGDAALEVSAGTLHGFLTEQRRQAVVAEVGAVVDEWIEQAWVAGPWPRTVTGVWGQFTPEAATSAAKDATVTSAAGHSERVDAVRVARRDVTVDLLAQQGTPHGATARLALSFDVSPKDAVDDGTRKVAVRGRLFLTPVDGGWKIFGHDLTRGGW